MNATVGSTFSVPFQFDPNDPRYPQCSNNTSAFPVYDAAYLQHTSTSYGASFRFRAKAPGVTFIRMGPSSHDVSGYDISVNITGPTLTPTPVTPTATPPPTPKLLSDSFQIQ